MEEKREITEAFVTFDKEEIDVALFFATTDIALVVWPLNERTALFTVLST